MFTPLENNRLLDYYKIISISIEAHIGLDFVSGQYGCLFSRCRKYVINSLIHGHFHIGLVIIARPILALDCVSYQYGGLGMITRPIWKCPCINLYLSHLRDHNILHHINQRQAYRILNYKIQSIYWELLINGSINCTVLHIIKPSLTNE